MVSKLLNKEPILLRTGPDEKYKNSEYASALKQAPYMVVVMTAENFANFIQEARACDVPSFLIISDGPDGLEWFHESAGQRCTVGPLSRKDPSKADQQWAQVALEFEEFRAKVELETFQPREYMESTLCQKALSDSLFHL